LAGDPHRLILELLSSCRETAGRRVRVRCARVGGVEYCLYTYKAVDWRVFYERPCLSYARGTVIVGGEHLILPFTKFFNYGEVPATRPEALPPRPLRVYEKLDGTLVVAWRDPVTGELRGNTRGLLWMQGMDGSVDPEGGVRNPFFRGLLEYARREGLEYELESLVAEGRAVMFELVVPGMPASQAHTLERIDEYARLVQDRGEAYLLAARDLGSLRLEPAPGGWPLTPKSYPGDPRLLEEALARHPGEGVVAWYEALQYEGPLRYLDPLVKYKSRVYLLRVTGIQSSRGLLAYALAGGLDDLRGVVSGERLQVLEEAYREYTGLLEAARRLHPHARKARGYGLRGWLLEVVEDPDRALTVLLRVAPKKLELVPGFIRRGRARLEEVARRIGVS